MTEKIDIKVFKNNRKRMVIKINPDNLEVSVWAPLRATNTQINAFIQANIPWIKQTQAKLAAKIDNSPQKFLYFGKEFEIEVTDKFASKITLIDKLYINPKVTDVNFEIGKFYFKMGAETVFNRIKELADDMNLKFNHVRFKNVSSRWGSCSSKKNININIKLIKAPNEIIDYVLIHELSHIKEMNHSPAFWQLVAQYDPNYKIHRKWLKENGARLMKELKI